MIRLNKNARNRVEPMTTGISFCRIAVVIKVPIPGMANTVSAMIAPPKEAPKLVPSVVTTGRRAFLSAWRMIIRFSPAPLALAVRIYSCLTVSSMADLVRRSRLAADPKDMVMVGRIKCFRVPAP